MSFLYDVRSGKVVKSKLYNNDLLLKDAFSFDPLTLFAAGKQGVFYDLSDKSTLFQDVAGLVPVTKDGDPVGLMLDKSQGLLVGSELATDGNFSSSSDFTIGGSATVGNGKLSFYNASGGDYVRPLSLDFKSGNIVTGTYYRITITISNYVSGVIVIKVNNGSDFMLSGNGTHTAIARAGTGSGYLSITGAANNTTCDINSISVKVLEGNHASQKLSTARPIYKKDVDKAWLYNDKIDDKLLVKLPAMTATVVKATDEGVSIDYPVNITAGDYAITSTSALGRDYGYLISNKELSASEITQVTNYFNTKRGV